MFSSSLVLRSDTALEQVIQSFQKWYRPFRCPCRSDTVFAVVIQSLQDWYIPCRRAADLEGVLQFFQECYSPMRSATVPEGVLRSQKVCYSPFRNSVVLTVLQLCYIPWGIYTALTEVLQPFQELISSCRSATVLAGELQSLQENYSPYSCASALAGVLSPLFLSASSVQETSKEIFRFMFPKLHTFYNNFENVQIDRRNLIFIFSLKVYLTKKVIERKSEWICSHFHHPHY